MNSRFGRHNNEGGVTLLELLVALGIFGLVIVIIFGAFSTSILIERRIIALRNAGDNIRFAIESINREIRTGNNFSGGDSSFSFTNAIGESVIYRINNNAIERSSNGGASYAPITGSEITINYMHFYVSGEPLNDGLEPRVTITIGISSQVGNQTANYKIQTTVSQRFLQS
ncbi:hypothetical protein A2567_02305 [Candidatus Azambacteria bacterium RIFOXYD1_FULL_42_11]|uniref:Prepilin-type N-terminal cleavage/methylation domain-containing protein n=4 Tax=Candidatus Azamiibacteriota TaxID=1752741 RepID=A0A0G0ZC22_9BACT|nr:MAG: hypothetical protein UV07_C0002G0015 [Candidatus Azambacteria bacterium GW2011_GWB1_42_17]KKS46209.1 MAG: hypothetical protein UV10_C0006G0017 [Candidatus Azambacteria bacterium GW2011_GWA1_42_19]KKS75590.1 MAG: hypothetical protein UV48_C0009G0023 [Candidatus Azambacteria bacterium GW2011_GWA2_42_9]KKS88802.1 MAG: hypothetical protein UV62_C0002G0050 [Parcubacteria group bacterium GW2011_GWC1_43_11]OGD43247.1 MAG: hypothetical protein A2567_02305 [Candidatus Azambacteria bacterium RIFO